MSVYASYRLDGDVDFVFLYKKNKYQQAFVNHGWKSIKVRHFIWREFPMMNNLTKHNNKIIVVIVSI